MVVVVMMIMIIVIVLYTEVDDVDGGVGVGVDQRDSFVQGGREHNLPILVSRVTSNSPAARCQLWKVNPFLVLKIQLK